MVIERSPREALELADGVIYTIKELHANNMPHLNAKLADARRRFCKEEESAAAQLLLELSFGLATLAVHVAKLQEAATDEKYAKQLWSSINVN